MKRGKREDVVFSIRVEVCECTELEIASTRDASAEEIGAKRKFE